MTVDGIVRIPLRRFEDERGWFCELRRDSLLPRPTVQTNVSLSRRGVIRGLHYHERGQDDLFACLQGMARVVVLDRGTGATFTEDIGEENPVALYIPGRHAHGFEALTDLLFVYHVTEEYDPADPDEHGIPWDDPRVEASMEHADTDRSPRGTRPSRPDHRRRRPARGRARGGVRGRRRAGAHARRLGRAVPAARRPSGGPTSSCTPPPGRTSTAPRTILRARPR